MVGLTRTSTFTRSYSVKHANSVDRKMSRLRVTENLKKEGKRGKTRELKKSGSWRLERVHSIKVALGLVQLCMQR